MTPDRPPRERRSFADWLLPRLCHAIAGDRIQLAVMLDTVEVSPAVTSVSLGVGLTVFFRGAWHVGPRIPIGRPRLAEFWIPCHEWFFDCDGTHEA